MYKYWKTAFFPNNFSAVRRTRTTTQKLCVCMYISSENKITQGQIYITEPYRWRSLLILRQENGGQWADAYVRVLFVHTFTDTHINIISVDECEKQNRKNSQFFVF